MKTFAKWKYLVRKPKSNYQQLFIKDRWVAARTLFGQAVGEDSRTPGQLAADYQLPLEAVLEAIAYCESNPPEIREDTHDAVRPQPQNKCGCPQESVRRICWPGTRSGDEER